MSLTSFGRATLALTAILAGLRALAACAADPDPAKAAADADAAAQAACNPVGTYEFARAQFSADGGQFCIDNAGIHNGTAKANAYVVAKNADGTFSFTPEGDNDGNKVKFTLDTAKCEMRGAEEPGFANVTDMQANYGTAQVTGTITVAFKIGTPTTATRTSVLDVGPAPPVTSVPCQETAVATGTKK